jgi:hypothetical protein
MSWIAVAVAGSAVAGSAISANATKKAQQQANATNQQLADDKNAFDWNSYLLQRGINAGGTARPGEIPASATAVNTSLPLWLTSGGVPAEQAILSSILGLGGFGQAAPASAASSSQDQLAEYYASNPAFAAEYNRHMGWIAQNAPGTDRRTPTEWLRDHLASDPASMNDFRAYFAKPVNPVEETVATSTSTPTLNPAYLELQDKAIGAVRDLFDGKYLDQQIAALAPILAARTTGAGNIYDASVAAADDIYGAAETGARSIYDADLLYADTYQQAAQQALNRILNQQSAQRARQGFVGTGSGDALTRARLTADYTQQGAGVRAQAGQSLAQRLAEAGTTRATTKGQAGVTRATTLGSAGEQDALSRLSLLTDDINRRLAGVNLPAGLAQSDLSIRRAGADAPYAAIDSMLARLNQFRSNATPGTLALPNIQPTINSGQIVGGAISNIGQAVGDYYNNKQLMDAIGKLGNSGSGSVLPSADSLSSLFKGGLYG